MLLKIISHKVEQLQGGGCFLLICLVLFSLVSDIEGADGLQLRKEHALKIFAYINSWTQR